MKKLVHTFECEKETKNTVRYSATSSEIPIQTIYVEKKFANGAKKIKVTLELLE